jgi:1,2-diacylglycerol 3-beta-galactosyltransferase
VHPKVFLMITDAGGGHRASAVALKAWAAHLHAPLDLQIVNVYREVWQRAEPLGRLTGFYGEDIYNFTLKHSLLKLAGHLRGAARLVANAPNPVALKDGVAWLRREKPALCVSLMPFVNDLHARICAEAGVPFSLVMTDLVDTRPFMWYTPRASREAQWVSAPCDLAASQAAEAGSTRVLESGLLLHPKYQASELRALPRLDARRKLGLAEEPFTVLLSMGGFGGSSMEDIVDNLEASGRGWQVVVICGRNEALKQRLERRPAGPHQLVPVGFTDQLQVYLRAADLMLGKPGPASLFEAVAANTPLVLDAAAAMPQEGPNADLAALHGIAVKVEQRRQLGPTVAAFAASPSALRCIEAAQAAYPLPAAGQELVAALLKSVAAAALPA